MLFTFALLRSHNDKRIDNSVNSELYDCHCEARKRQEGRETSLSRHAIHAIYWLITHASLLQARKRQTKLTNNDSRLHQYAT